MQFRKGELVTLTDRFRRHYSGARGKGIVAEDQSAGSPLVMVHWLNNGVVSSIPTEWMMRMKNAV